MDSVRVECVYDTCERLDSSSVGKERVLLHAAVNNAFRGSAGAPEAFTARANDSDTGTSWASAISMLYVKRTQLKLKAAILAAIVSMG